MKRLKCQQSDSTEAAAGTPNQIPAPPPSPASTVSQRMTRHWAAFVWVAGSLVVPPPLRLQCETALLSRGLKTNSLQSRPILQDVMTLSLAAAPNYG